MASSRASFVSSEIFFPVEPDQRARDDIRQPLENILVQLREDRAVDRVQRLQHAEALVLVHQRGAQHRAGDEPGLLVRRPQQARIVLGVVDPEEFPLLEDRPGDPLVPRNAEGVDRVVLASCRVDDQLAAGPVWQEHRARLHLHHRPRVLEDVLHQVVQTGQGKEIARGQQQGAVPVLHGRVVHQEISLKHLPPFTNKDSRRWRRTEPRSGENGLNVLLN